MNFDGSDLRYGMAPGRESDTENRFRYAVAGGTNFDTFLRDLELRHAIRRHAPVRLERIYLDTFDRRLAKKRLTLSALRGDGETRLALENARGEEHYGSMAGLPAFAADLPAGPIWQHLQSIIEPRRLLVLVKVKGQTQTVDVLDKRDKTVGWLTMERLTASPPGGKTRPRRMTTVLNLEATRGFGSAVRPVREIIEARSGFSRTGGSTFSEALAAIGRPGEFPSSRKHYGLQADMRTDEALKKILTHLVDSMEANESGVRNNLDAEFLHDFRVALRRMQSALAQIKDVFAPDRVSHFRAEFKWLRKVTNPVRDLDVQLLHIEQDILAKGKYRREDLESLVHYLTARNRTHRHRLVSALESDRYRTLMKEWREFLQTPADNGPGCENASRAVSEVARETIGSARDRVLRDARAVSDAAPAKTLHRLRIDCKKLRYLLEFFSELFEPTVAKNFTRALKHLQDYLGDFQDLQVQRESLEHTAYEMSKHGSVPVGTLLVVGQMMHQLESRQRKVRKQFSRKFSKFQQVARDNQLEKRSEVENQKAP